MTREELAARQARLVAALVDSGPVPEGIDPGRLAVAARALAAKRRRALERSVSDDVVDALGDALPARLEAWIAAHPRATGTGMHDDAAAFRASLRADGTLRPRPWWRRALRSPGGPGLR